MRLHKLEIRNIRGIRELTLKPDGKNLVIWGPNGSGKSAIVDSIDFLLTGKISRLTGKGTRDIVLNRHGPHIDHKPKDAWVSAIVQLSGSDKNVKMTRCMATPADLDCEVLKEPSLQKTLILAERGQHVLTRREVLKYITAEASTRAQEIQQLLNVSEVEDIRKVLVRVQNDLKQQLNLAIQNLESAKASAKTEVQQENYDEAKVLEVVNRNRSILNGPSIKALHSSELKKGLSARSSTSDPKTVNLALLAKDIQNLLEVMIPKNQNKIAESDRKLRDSLNTIRSDEKLIRALSRLELTRRGVELIDESGACPLCDTQWPAGELREHLEGKISSANAAEKHQKRISELSLVIRNSIDTKLASIQKVIEAAQVMDREEDVLLLQSWLEQLGDIVDSLASALDKYPRPSLGAAQVQKLLAPANLEAALSNIYSAATKKFPSPTSEQNAWDSLTRLEEKLKAIEKTGTLLESLELSHRKAEILLLRFQEARDGILGKLYEEIKDRFVSLYREIHDDDESEFSAKMEPERAGLKFEVDFYGRGTHPPHALHSEGHQDSMGLCLYLALTENLTEGMIDLIVLDDVVMSVDTGHRKALCRLLASSFPDKQFLITTHDRTWANQLKSEGVVDTKGIVEFFNWNVDSGPYVVCGKDVWDRIDDDLQKNDIPSAAARLRRGLEQFFGDVCDALQVYVKFNSAGQWELGELLFPAMDRYKELLKKAKNSAKSWDKSDNEAEFEKMDKMRSQIRGRTQAELWPVNTNIHYNNWANFTEPDFRPVVKAFKDLCGLFVCSGCGSMLRLAFTGLKPVSVRCNCLEVNWNLMKKEEEGSDP